MKEFIDLIFKSAIEIGASDVLLSVGAPPMVRINGDLKPIGNEKLTSEKTQEMAKTIMTEQCWEKFLEKGEQDFSFAIFKEARFRVNAFKQRSSISMVFRIIPTEIPSLEELYMPKVIQELINCTQGLILVTGPTGSGKSTTLASMINYLNQSFRKHIITLEDPIEYSHCHVNSIIEQREIGLDTSSFASGLRAALRQDPDVILVGEMRDLETISVAVTAAETGHLVYGTLHTSNTYTTVDRIIDVFPPEQQAQVRSQLANVLLVILSQRLLPTIDNKGRRAAVEILINNSAVANLIRNAKNNQIPSVMQTSRTIGMQTIEMAVLDLLQQGIISTETAQPFLTNRSY